MVKIHKIKKKNCVFFKDMQQIAGDMQQIAEGFEAIDPEKRMWYNIITGCTNDCINAREKTGNGKVTRGAFQNEK